MNEANKTILRRWVEEVWNRKQMATIGELFAASGVAHGLENDGSDVCGPNGFEAFATRILEAVPDLEARIDDLAAEGDRVAFRFTFEGTHTGAGLEVAPTGKRICIRGMAMVHLENGQIVEAWNYFAQPGLARQIGAA